MHCTKFCINTSLEDEVCSLTFVYNHSSCQQVYTAVQLKSCRRVFVKCRKEPSPLCRNQSITLWTDLNPDRWIWIGMFSIDACHHRAEWHPLDGVFVEVSNLPSAFSSVFSVGARISQLWGLGSVVNFCSRVSGGTLRQREYFWYETKFQFSLTNAHDGRAANK